MTSPIDPKTRDAVFASLRPLFGNGTIAEVAFARGQNPGDKPVTGVTIYLARAQEDDAIVQRIWTSTTRFRQDGIFVEISIPGPNGRTVFDGQLGSLPTAHH